jgi:hypothetical protein
MLMYSFTQGFAYIFAKKKKKRWCVVWGFFGIEGKLLPSMSSTPFENYPREVTRPDHLWS